jgi:sec-independent protein translocase protein TatB
VFGINGSEFIVLLVVAAVVLGPERLPHYAAQLGRLVRELRRMAQGASQQMREELGPEFDDIDWRKLDPRQYDPRRIVREALSDSLDPDDPLGVRGAGLDRASLGLDDDLKPVSRGGPGERRRRVRPPAPEPDASADGAVNGSVNGSVNGAVKPAVDDVPLDPDAT